ncbi:MAG: right-handed parallel beta-helix repeat-containing protein [Thermomicrobiales bacterium]
MNCGNCANPTPICQDHVCVACERRDQCASDEICYEGRCQACDVTCQAGTCSNADLLAAIGSAAPGGTVYICPGRYTGLIVPAKDVSLVGAGSGEATTAETVLDAAGAGRVIDIPQDLTVGLHQLRITGGYIQDTQGGAGIRHAGRLLTMTDCTVVNNVTEMTQNIVPVRGTIINGSASRLEMTRCTVRNNRVGIYLGYEARTLGGGIYNANELVMSDCVIRDNTTKSDGGGLFNYSGSATLTNCRITRNTLTEPGLDPGGGVLAKGGPVTLENCYVWDNLPSDCSGTVTGSDCGVTPPS